MISHGGGKFKVTLIQPYILLEFNLSIFMLLLIEDNITIANNIKKYLELQGHSVEAVYDGTSWLNLALERQYELIILDVMLPGMDGFEILQQVRQTKQVPVIMTTAKGQIEDKSIWYEHGADDYLVKPFEMKELVLRIQALLKRSQVSDIIKFKDLEINTLDNEVTKDGKLIKLTNKERLVLSAILDDIWHAVSRSDIIDFVRWWDSVWQNDSKLDVYISNLRRKLDKELIETVKGFGYKIPRK